MHRSAICFGAAFANEADAREQGTLMRDVGMNVGMLRCIGTSLLTVGTAWVMA